MAQGMKRPCLRQLLQVDMGGHCPYDWHAFHTLILSEVEQSLGLEPSPGQPFLFYSLPMIFSDSSYGSIPLTVDPRGLWQPANASFWMSQLEDKIAIRS